MDSPRIKQIIIKLDKDYSFNINNGVLSIQSIKDKQQNINLNKLNKAINSIKNNLGAFKYEELLLKFFHNHSNTKPDIWLESEL